jgi:predicted secreted hydrolase
MRRVLILVLVLILAALAWTLWPRPRGEVGASLVAQAAPADAAGFARAEPGQPLVFPRDQGPHDDYQTEWWYYTGNLQSETGEHFGYQLTFFRRALTPPDQRTRRASDWAADQVYMAHFALTDVAGNRHQSFEKLSRGAGGVAGARAEPFRVWLEDWFVSSEEPVVRAGAATTEPYRQPPVRLKASAGDLRLDLLLEDTKGPILQGDRGYSQKGSDPGNASYYYSLTRMLSTGSVAIGDKTYAVTGSSWMDHEYSTSALGREQAGWDWFSIQLDNQTELMVFQLRRADGSVDPFSSGTLVAADTSTTRLGPGDFKLETIERWRSPRSGAEYPSRWRLTVPSAGLDLEVTPYVSDQEMQVSYVYWEGAVRVTGTADERPISGHGYVELTGYAGSMKGQF